MTAHAKLSPSSAERWMTCPGSVRLSEGIPNETNDAADLGTAKHWVSAMCLLNDVHPATYIGSTILVGGGRAWMQRNREAERRAVSFTVKVDTDFAGDCNKYVHAVRKYSEGALWVAVEVEVPIGQITGENGATGTADCVIVTADGELQCHDAKFGYREVAVERNKQAMLYVAGARHRLPDEIHALVKGYRAVIHQPAHGPATEWAFGEAELLVFEHEAEASANATYKPDAPLVPSEKGCAFCPAKATCPALAAFVQDSIGASFDTITTQPPAAPGKFDLMELGDRFAALPLIETWMKAVRARVEAVLFEHNNDASVQKQVGAKIVDGKQGNRAWTDEAQAEAVFKSMRLKQEQMYEFKVISPTTAEKLLAEHPKRWAKIAPLIHRPPGKPSVALLDDKRPAKVIAPVADAFDAVEDTGEHLV